jgi:hypothetical protein
MYRIVRSLIVGFGITAAALLVMDMPLTASYIFTLKRYAPIALVPGQFLVNAATNGKFDPQNIWLAATLNTVAWGLFVLLISIIFRLIWPVERPRAGFYQD